MQQSSIATSMADKGTWEVKLTGQLTEETQFPAPPTDIRGAVIDLRDVDSINSSGVRSWLVWTKALMQQLGQNSGSIELRNVPLAFLRLMEFIQDMMPAGSVMASFQASYACLDCAKVHHIPMQNSPNDPNAKILKGENPPACSACGFETELELTPTFYQFLSRYAPKR